MMTDNTMNATVRVTDIEISDLHYSHALGHQLANVSITLIREGVAAHIHLLCRAARPDDCPEDTVTHDVIDDALRQVRRMPGVRRGERQIDVDISTATLIKTASPA